MSDIISNYLTNENITLTSKQLIALAKQIRKPMWDWHIIFGYILAGLFAVRFMLSSTGIVKIKNPFNKNLDLKVKFQYSIYLVFYVLIFVTLITGLLIEFGPESLKKIFETVHKLSLYYIVPYIIIHLIGVIIGELTTDKGVVSKMIGGE